MLIIGFIITLVIIGIVIWLLSDKIFDELYKLREEQKDEFDWFKSQKFITQQDLEKTERNIMSKISEFADRQNAFNDRIDAAVTDLQGDIKSLNDTIAALQASVGTVTPEDQALLDQIETRAGGIATKLEALDALTPPVVPVTV